MKTVIALLNAHGFEPGEKTAGSGRVKYWRGKHFAIVRKVTTSFYIDGSPGSTQFDTSDTENVYLHLQRIINE